MKIRIGDIVEIRTSKGLAYAIYTHMHKPHPTYGAMIRIFDQLYQERPDELATLTASNVRFTVFFPLQAAVNKRVVEIVDNTPVPDHLKQFPLFRADQPRFPGQTETVWWLWDGEREWRVGKLTPEQHRLPIREIWNYTLLVERIEEGWTPESDPT